MYFIITIDTEGDNIWNGMLGRNGIKNVKTENAKYIGRFQNLCNKYGFIPTYLVNHEMANSDIFTKQAKEWRKDRLCEIGMHMHSWNTPPIYDLPYRKESHNPYAGDYPHKVMWRKLKYMTQEIEAVFGEKPTSHRGGRWYLDPWYVQALIKLGYIVDCSVTPGVSWKGHIGYEIYGCDYRKYPSTPYYMNGRKLAERNQGGLLEIQPTIRRTKLKDTIRSVVSDPVNMFEILNKRMWLRPIGENLNEMLMLADTNEDYIELMLHSSELMPGGSPNFQTAGSIEKLYKDMECLFERVAETRRGISLSDYAGILKERERHL